MNRPIDRIKEIAEDCDMTLTEMERVIGASKGVLTRAASKGTNIQLRWLEAIAEKFPAWNAEWIIAGKGKPTDVEVSIAVKKSEFPQQEYEIPLLDLDASAGFSSVDALGDNSRRTLTLPKCDGAITIVGKSMDPTIHDGDIAVFDMVNSPSSIRPDGIYIVQYTDEDNDVHLTVKRVKRSPEGKSYIRLSADNPEYGYEDVPLESISRVAKVLYTITKLSY